LNGDLLVRCVFFATLVPLIGALAARLSGRRRLAFLLSSLVPSVVLVAGALAALTNGLGRITTAGLAVAAIPVASLLVCVAGGRSDGLTSLLLFWLVFAVNALMIAFCGYLAFWFHIF
jgi:hypothetical protein